MGRKSKLNTEQWAQIKRRLIEGESRRALGREFGISEASIREKLAGPVDEIKGVAMALVDADVRKAQADARLSALDPLAQVSAQSLAVRLRAISDDLAGAAANQAASALMLSALARKENERITARPDQATADHVKAQAVLTRLVNDSAELPLALMTGPREKTLARLQGEGPPVLVDGPDLSDLSDDELDQLDALLKRSGGNSNA